MKLGIIGTGLIGGSLGLALKNNKEWAENSSNKILCFNRRQEVSKEAISLNISDEICNSIDEITEKSDVLIIATNLSSYDEISKQIAKNLTKEKIISDVGSVKFLPSEIIKNNFFNFSECFISAHPIAGKEISGVNSADKNLYKNKKIIICDNKNSNIQKIETIKKIWQLAGGFIEFLDAKLHDKIYAKISHFPQLLSFACKNYISNDGVEANEFCRLQSSPINMWQEIFYYNKENLEAEIKNFINNFTAIKNECEFIEINENSIQNENFISAFLISKIIFNNTEEIYKNYAGSGFRSITNLAEKYKTSNCTRKVLEKSFNLIEKIQNELENWNLSRNF